MIVQWITKFIHAWQNRAVIEHQNAMEEKASSSVEVMKTSVAQVADAANSVAKLLAEKPHTPEALLLCDLDGNIIKCNVQSEELFLSDVNNHAISDLLHWPEDADWRSMIATMPAMEKRIAMAAIPYSGTTFAAEVTMVRLVDTPPSVPRVLMMIRRTDPDLQQQYRDVAEQVQSALQRLNKQFSRSHA